MSSVGAGLILLGALLVTPGVRAAAQKPGGKLQVVILPFRAGDAPEPAVARAADRCAARLLERLSEAGVRAARLPDATLEGVRKEGVAAIRDAGL